MIRGGVSAPEVQMSPWGWESGGLGVQLAVAGAAPGCVFLQPWSWSRGSGDAAARRGPSRALVGETGRGWHSGNSQSGAGCCRSSGWRVARPWCTSSDLLLLPSGLCARKRKTTPREGRGDLLACSLEGSQRIESRCSRAVTTAPQLFPAALNSSLPLGAQPAPLPGAGRCRTPRSSFFPWQEVKGPQFPAPPAACGRGNRFPCIVAA